MKIYKQKSKKEADYKQPLLNFYKKKKCDNYTKLNTLLCGGEKGKSLLRSGLARPPNIKFGTGLRTNRLKTIINRFS